MKKGRGGAKIIITTNWLKNRGACSEGMEWFSMQSETDGRVIVENLISAGKLEWANWLIARMLDHTDRIRYAVFAAEQVLDIFEKQYPDDKRPRIAIEAARLVIKNDTPETRAAADAAGESAEAAWAAGNASWSARNAAWSARESAWTARNAAKDAGDAPWSARESAEGAGAAAEAAGAAAWSSGNADEVSIKIKIIKYGISLLEGK